MVKRFRSPWIRYAGALLAVGTAVGLTYALAHTLGARFPGYPFLYLVAIMAAAWWGYGPGFLACVVTTFLVPYLFIPRFTVAKVDPGRFVLLLLVSALISFISAGRKRAEAALRKSNEELDERIRVRTSDLEQANNAVRESEERLRFVLDSAHIGYWDYDVAKNLTTRSLKHDQIFGHESLLPLWNNEILLEHVHPGDRELLVRTFRQTLSTGEQELEFRSIWPDGSVHWIWAHGRAHRDQGGRAARVTGLILDITARKNAEESLKESEERFRTMADSAPVLIWTAGTDTLCNYFNQPWLDFTGRGIEQALGNGWAEAVHPDDRQCCLDTYLEAFNARKNLTMEYRLRRHDGEYRWVLDNGVPRFTPAGEFAGYIGSCLDITERKQLEESLRQTAKLESLGVLAGGVAHDFNNLLVGIMGNASLVLDSLSPASTVRPMVEQVVQASERAASLTRQLLAYAGKGRFVVQPIDLSELVREITTLIKSSIPRGVQLRLNLSEHLLPVEADVSQMEQVIMNLVINAAEAIGPDVGTVIISTAMQDVDEDYIRATFASAEITAGTYIYLEVQDSGCGMDAATQARIFDPFFTTKFTGRGLGLAAVLGIVRGHKGALKVYSAPGKGTTFKILFPAMAAEPVRSTPVPAKADISGNGLILIVDDEDLVLRTAKATLERYGYRAVVAKHGQEAVEIFEKTADQIALVLLDLTMPVMSGEETLRRLRTMRPNVPVLLSSGFNEVEAIQRFQNRGLAGFVQKPYTGKMLAEKVKNILDGSRSLA